MSALRQCDLCGKTVKLDTGEPSKWTSISMMNIDGEKSIFSNIDICTQCSEIISERFDLGTEFINTGKIEANEIPHLQSPTIRKILMFILTGNPTA